MRVVSNAGPLIALGKLGQLGFGLLLDAFRRDYLSLPEFELLIQNIKAQPSLWIAESLCDRALAQARAEAGEARSS